MAEAVSGTAGKMEGAGDAAASTAAKEATGGTIAPGRRWADEAEEEEEEEKKTEASSSEQKSEDLKRLEALRIADEEKKEETKGTPSEGLDEPEDSAIKAVSFHRGCGSSIILVVLGFYDLLRRWWGVLD